MTVSKIEQYNDLESVVRSLEFLDTDTLRATLAYIIKIYIIDKGINFEGVVNSAVSTAGPGTDEPVPLRSSTFSHLLSELKRTYSFPELELFEVDNNTVYVTLNGKRELLTKPKGEAQVEMPASRSKIPENIKKTDNSRPGEQPARFKNLEMD